MSTEPQQHWLAGVLIRAGLAHQEPIALGGSLEPARFVARVRAALRRAAA